MAVIILLANPCNVSAVTISSLTTAQQKNAEIIAEIVSDNWDTYGVLPSIAVAQALQETSLGKAYNNGNLWGIKSGRVSYPSVADGTYAYMRVINNGYYKNAPFQTDYRKQIRAILDGGYCVPEGDYYSNIIYMVEKYNLDDYDKQMFKKIEEKKKKLKAEEERKKKEKAKKERLRKIKAQKEKARKAKWKYMYTMEYDESVPDNAVYVNREIIKKGTVRIYDMNHMELKGIYDAYAGSHDYVIKTSNKHLAGQIVSLDVIENSKG